MSINNMESILKNKKEFEGVLEKINKEITYQERDDIIAYLENIIGSEDTFELMSILNELDADTIKESDYNDELKSYLYYIKGKYGRKISSYLSNDYFQYPNSWSIIEVSNLKYDIEKGDYIIQLNILKNNYETTILENTLKSHIQMLNIINNYLIDRIELFEKYNLISESKEQLNNYVENVSKLKTLIEKYTI